MTDFDTFKSNLIDWFLQDDNTLESTAATITQEYVAAVEAGQDPLAGNAVTTFNQAALEQAIVATFQASFNGNVPFNLAIVAPGLITFWTGAVLATSGTVAGTTSTVSNLVTAPGTPVPIPMPQATDSVEPFIDTLVTFFQTHLTTVAGTIIGVVPGSPPVPTPFPWVGYL